MNQQQADRLDRLVEDYLGAVSWACGDLSPQRRDELIEDLREHVAAARSVLHQPTEAAVRTILDRLGEPTAIAEEARLAEGLGPSTSAPAPQREVRRSPSATLGMLLGFVLILVVILVSAALLLMASPGR